MTANKLTTYLLVFSIILVFGCFISWIVGINAAAIAARDIITLTALALLFASLVANILMVKLPSRNMRLLRVAGSILLLLFVALFVTLALLLGDTAERMKEF